MLKGCVVGTKKRVLTLRKVSVSEALVVDAEVPLLPCPESQIFPTSIYHLQKQPRQIVTDLHSLILIMSATKKTTPDLSMKALRLLTSCKFMSEFIPLQPGFSGALK